MDINLTARNNALGQLFQARKQELTNVIEIIKLIAEPNADVLGATMTSAQYAATLKDKLAAANPTLAINTANQILAALNAALGTAYTTTDLQSGAIESGALNNALAAILRNHKLVIYAPMSLVGVAEGVSQLVLGTFSYADATDWSMPQFGGHGAPYNAATPVPVSSVFAANVRVDVMHNEQPILIDGMHAALGYISSFDALTNTAGITWGYKNSEDVFVEASLPSSVVGLALSVILPIKSNLAIVPVDFLAFARGARSAVSAPQDLSGIETILQNNGLAADSNLKAVLGVSAIQAMALQEATQHVLSPEGYSSVSVGLVDLMTRIHALTGFVEEFNTYLGKLSGEALPAYNPSAIFGDVRDVISNQMPIKDAIGALNKALYKGNILHVAKTGGHYSTITNAILAITDGQFGAPSNDNPFLIAVAPGVYAENIALADHVYVYGSGMSVTRIQGSVVMGNVPATTNGVHSRVANLSVASVAVPALQITGNNIYMPLINVGLKAIDSYALDISANMGAVVSVASGSTIESTTTAIRMLGNELYIDGALVTGQNTVILQGGANLVMNSGSIASSATAVAVEATSSFTIHGGRVSGNAGITANSGTLRLFGGSIDATMSAVTADATSLVELGACAIDPAKLAISSASVQPKIQSSATFVKDAADYFLGNDVETVLQEVGSKLQAEEIITENLHAKINAAEDDALVETCLLQLSLMPLEYTMVMVESFKQVSSNLYPAGIDKALVDVVKSELRHQGSMASNNYFVANFAGDVAGKSKVLLRQIISAPSVAGNNDWEIQFRFEVTGGRYGANTTSYLLRAINPFNLTQSRQPAEINLTTLIPEGAPQFPILQGVDEVASMKIVIKQDSTGAAATPSIRSFAAFI